jgi:predicted tellurium resistance membrane protein TerC
MDFPDFTSGAVWMSLLTLTFLEIVLGIDNIIFITIVTNKLKEADKKRARNIGLILAMALRIVLLFGIGFIMTLQKPLFEINWGPIHGSPSGQSFILLLGGLFLMYKATTEIGHKLEGDVETQNSNFDKVSTNLGSAISQIAVINVIFSIDSILTAIGLTSNVPIMIISVIVSVLIMMWFAGPLGNFVNQHPTIQMLGLAFLILIGVMLVAEALHLAHFMEGSIPKGYLYFAIAFSVGVEFLNMKLRKKSDAVQLHGVKEQAVKEGYLEKADEKD